MHRAVLRDSQKEGDFTYTDNEKLSQQLLAQVQGCLSREQNKEVRSQLGVDGIKNNDDLGRSLANM